MRRLYWLSLILYTASIVANQFIRDKPRLPILILEVLGVAGLVASAMLKDASSGTDLRRRAARALAVLVGFLLLTIGFSAGALRDVFLLLGAAMLVVAVLGPFALGSVRYISRTYSQVARELHH